MHRFLVHVAQIARRLALAGLALAVAATGATSLLDGPEANAASKTVTTSFSNTAGVSFPTFGIANPYSSAIDVKGLDQGQIVNVNLILHGLSHGLVDDIDLMLVHGNTNLVVMSDAGGDNAATNLTLTFDDGAASTLPDSTALASGTFLPTNHLLYGDDPFLAPAPVPSANTTLAAFNGLDPSGEWLLFGEDDNALGNGTLTSWELQITATVPDNGQHDQPGKNKGKGKHDNGKDRHKKAHHKGKGKKH